MPISHTVPWSPHFPHRKFGRLATQTVPWHTLVPTLPPPVSQSSRINIQTCVSWFFGRAISSAASQWWRGGWQDKKFFGVQQRRWGDPRNSGSASVHLHKKPIAQLRAKQSVKWWCGPADPFALSSHSSCLRCGAVLRLANFRFAYARGPYSAVLSVGVERKGDERGDYSEPVLRLGYSVQA